ncbi:MAG: hypothetical protein E7463_06440 [Ruminococcaceae bacterium]|nr:hypothetical protein [Oscillospiraceae bacterium]
MANSGKSKGSFYMAMHEADGFFEIAALCDEHYLQNDVASNLLFPFVINLSFACEAYIKAIMIHYSPTNEFEHGHNLKDLFAMLPQHCCQEIEANYRNEVIGANQYIDLHSLLDAYGNSFVEWRYGFVTSGNDLEIHSTNMSAFARCLRQHCNQINDKLLSRISDGIMSAFKG